MTNDTEDGFSGDAPDTLLTERASEKPSETSVKVAEHGYALASGFVTGFLIASTIAFWACVAVYWLYKNRNRSA